MLTGLRDMSGHYARSIVLLVSRSSHISLSGAETSANSVIKSELVQRVARQNPHLYSRDIENVVNAVLDGITGALARGDRVELRGFGAFSIKRRSARLGRNPRTGSEVHVAAKAAASFKTGKEMHERLNRNEA